MTPGDRRLRGYAAKVLVEDETLKAAWDDLENDIRAQWEACWLPRKRDRLWTELRTIRALRSRLAGYARWAKDD